MKNFIIPISISMMVILTGCGKKPEIIDIEIPEKVIIIPEYQDPPKHSEMKGEPKPTQYNEKGEVISDPNRIMLNENANDDIWDNALTK